MASAAPTGSTGSIPSLEAAEALLRSIPDAALLHDGAIILAANAAAAVLYGAGPVERLSGLALSAVVRAAPMGAEALRLDGGRVEVELQTHDLSTEPPRHVTYLRERSCESALERRLGEALARLGETERLARLGSWELDLQTNRLVWSEEIYRIFELDPVQFGASYDAFLDAIHPDDRARVAQAYERSLREKTPYEITHRIRTRGGAVKYVRERCESFFAADGTPLRSIGTVQDITSVHRLEVFRHVADSSIGGVAGADEDGTITFASRTFARMFGHDGPEALVGTPAKDLWLEPALALAAFERMRTNGSDVREQLARTRQGDVRAIQIASSRVTDPSGAPAGFFGLFFDVTDRVNAEQALAEHRAILQQVVDASPDWIFAKDRAHNFLVANRAFAAGAGTTPAAMVGRPDTDFWPRELCVGDPATGRTGFHQDDDRAVAGELVRNPRDLVQYPDGRRAELDMLKGPLRASPDGPIFGLFALGRDVTLQREEQRQIEALSQQLQAMLDAFPDLLFRLDRDDRIADIREAREAASLLPREQLIGRTIQEFLGLEVAQGALAAVARVRATGRATSYEYQMPSPGGPREFEARFVPGAAGDVLIVVRDMTDPRATERKLRSSEEQLRQAQKLDAIGHLAGGIAHDFNNMLTVVLSVAGALREATQAQPEGRALVDELVAAGERAAALTRQLLAFARLNPAEPDVLELPALVRDFSGFLRRIVGEQVELQLELDPATRAVRLDPSHLEQVLLNFAVNARDAMPSGGRLLFRCRDAPGEEVVLEASDTGCGMDEAVRARLFEPFFTTKPAGKGTGLGLATVYGIVRQAGGRIEVESTPGAGSTFRVLLPAVAAAAVTATRTEVTTRPPRGAGTVLLVEDDAPVRAVTRRILAGAGFAVLEAASGAAALGALEAGANPALLLTDVVMPGLTGPALARAVRARLPELPVVFVSGHAHAPEVLEGLGPLVRKPYAGEALLRAVDAALRGARAG